MSSKPHSKTVRGTLDNPKTKEAMKSQHPIPRLGDATSLKPANDEVSLPSNDSAPPRGQGNDAGSDPGAPTVSDPYQKHESAQNAPSKSSIDGLPHSKKVKGTLANNEGKKVNPTQLGDPASLKAETSNTRSERDIEREGKEHKDIAKSKL